MSNLEILIPLGAFVVFAYVITQYLQHRQRMRMIDRGITKLEFTQAAARTDNSIKYGLVTIALGLAILLAQLFEDVFRTRLGGEIGLALVPIFVGVALIVYALMDRRASKEKGSEAVEMKSSAE